MQQKAQKQFDMLQKVQVLPVTSPLVGQTCICAIIMIVESVDKPTICRQIKLEQQQLKIKPKSEICKLCKIRKTKSTCLEYTRRIWPLVCQSGDSGLDSSQATTRRDHPCIVAVQQL